MPIYGYARCSTTESKQDIERQSRELIALGATQVFSEYAKGTNDNRSQLQSLLDTIQPGDTIAVTEVSRLSRDIHHLCHIEQIVSQHGATLLCGSLRLDYASRIDPMHRAMFYIMGVFAELERGVTVERINSGLASAKKKGVVLGRPPLTKKDIPPEVKKLLPAFKAGEFGISEFARRTGLTRPSIYKYLAILDTPPKESRKMTAAAVPQKVREIYPDYKSGNISVSEYARRTGLTRNTVYRHIALLESECESKDNPEFD